MRPVLAVGLLRESLVAMPPARWEPGVECWTARPSFWSCWAMAGALDGDPIRYQQVGEVLRVEQGGEAMAYAIRRGGDQMIVTGFRGG